MLVNNELLLNGKFEVLDIVMCLLHMGMRILQLMMLRQ